jgi:hypothetical protein
MNTIAEKNIIKKELDNIDDVHLIKAIHEMIKYAKSSKEEAVLKPFTKAQVIKRALQSEDDIKHNRVTSLNKLKKEIKRGYGALPFIGH